MLDLRPPPGRMARRSRHRCGHLPAHGLGAAVALLLGGGPLAAGALAPRPTTALPPDLQPLVAALRRHGFQVRIALPPRRGAYGQFDPRRRILWISPLSFELGIARQTFLHEAVHAVQSCPSGLVRPIGWQFRLDPAVERGISAILLNGYHHANRVAEKEAFALQGQPDAVPILLGALRRRCRGGG